MIPKVIHYCWFGGNPLPESAQKCIISWKKYFPDYEIQQWNESNFDVQGCDYIREACEAKKWAFVSDYARFWILYHHGGLYFDTDVEVIRSFNDILAQGPFMGCEGLPENTSVMGINPGLGLGAEKSMPLYKEVLDFYQSKHFLKENGEQDKTTIVDYTTAILSKHGWVPSNVPRTVAGVTVYPPEYFCPMDYMTGKISITEHTCSIHHYTASWLNHTEEKIAGISRFFTSRFGVKTGYRIARIVDFPLRVKNKADALGVAGMLKFAAGKCMGRSHK